jgi:hypothetical protein
MFVLLSLLAVGELAVDRARLDLSLQHQWTAPHAALRAPQRSVPGVAAEAPAAGRGEATHVGAPPDPERPAPPLSAAVFVPPRA